MPDEPPLVLTFDPQTVDHLGAKMYSHLPNALAEIVANSYDADATRVMIKIEPEGTISVTDDGHGMSREDVREKYLHIGRNRRTTEPPFTESGTRAVSGKKGLGKLALFGIGRRIELKTTRKGSEDRTQIVLDYDEMKMSDGDYHPSETRGAIDSESHGTVVRLSQLKRTSPISAEKLAKSLARLFNYVDADFRVDVVGLDGESHRVTADSRLDAITPEFEWTFPEDGGAENQELAELGVVGRIVSSEKPMPQGLRGLALYVNGRMANEAGFFDASGSSYAYSYISGFLVADYLDSLVPDVIATDRRSIDWDTDATLGLRDLLTNFATWLAGDWRRLRAEKSKRASDSSLGGSSDDWIASIKTEEGQAVRDIVEAIASEDVEIPALQQGELLRLVQRAVPLNAEYAWRHLHPEIQDATRAYYLNDDFFGAVQEAIKRYVLAAKAKAGIDYDEATQIVSSAFGDAGKLRVFDDFVAHFTTSTARNVENGQKHVSMGIVAGFRNPLAHEEIERLHSSGAFTFDDCLDALSIISHLMRRLDQARLADGRH